MCKPASYLGLTRWDEYKSKFISLDLHRNPEPAAYEYVSASAFSNILYLPMQCSSDRNDGVDYRVLWDGDIIRGTRSVSASSSGSDTVCFAFGFYILCESTIRTGRGQWKKEFNQCLQHYEDFITDNNLNSEDVFLVLVTPEIHKFLYRGFQSQMSEGYNLVLLNNSWLSQLWEISRIIPTVRHIDVREILDDLVEELSESTSFHKFKSNVNRKISIWCDKILRDEKYVFFALRAYEAMKKIGLDLIATSDIMSNLKQDDMYNKYMEIIDCRSLPVLIKESLIKERIGKFMKRVKHENYFCPLNIPEYKELGNRLIRSVEEIGGC